MVAVNGNVLIGSSKGKHDATWKGTFTEHFLVWVKMKLNQWILNNLTCVKSLQYIINLSKVRFPQFSGISRYWNPGMWKSDLPTHGLLDIMNIREIMEHFIDQKWHNQCNQKLFSYILKLSIIKEQKTLLSFTKGKAIFLKLEFPFNTKFYGIDYLTENSKYWFRITS